MSSTSREFFEQMYRTTRDPWSFASSEYERRRYDAILGHVPAGHFDNVFEPGCSVGVLTAGLAERCGFVTAIDIAEAAIVTARDRCRKQRNVDVHQGSLLDDMPDGPFDLVVFSEIGYYFTRLQLIDLASSLSSRILADGQLIAAHWTGVSADHVLGGEDVHRILLEHLPMEHLRHETHASSTNDGFVLDIWHALPEDVGE